MISRSFITALARLLKFDLCMLVVKARFKAAALSFLLVAAFLFSSASSFADFRPDSSFRSDSLAVTPVDALGTAFVTRAALGALGVEIAASLTDLSPDDIARAMWYGGGSTLPPSYSYTLDLGEYLSRQTIRIRPDTITIGGVDYSDVWLPYDAADKFRTNAFDFITRYNLSSQSNGTFLSGAGICAGVPIFSDGSNLTSQYYVVTNGGVVGDITCTYSSSSFAEYRNYYANGTRAGSSLKPSYGVSFFLGDQQGSSLRGCFYGVVDSTNVPKVSETNAYFPFASQPFDFNWVTQYIPSEPLPSDYGLRTRLPSTYVRDLPQILDPSSESYSSDLSSLISGLESSASEGTLTDPAFEEWDTPVPPASNTIADEPYSSLSGALSGISSFLNTISTSVSGIAESIISGDAGFFGNVVSALAAPFEPVFAIFRSGVGIWHYVVSWVGTISAPFTWSLSALGSAGSYFLSPIYAAAAAAVVLAVYKKFGR